MERTWRKGHRVACVGDAVHPVSPHAAYAEYQAERARSCNRNVEFARKLGAAGTACRLR
jgi:hypothetical protein